MPGPPIFDMFVKKSPAHQNHRRIPQTQFGRHPGNQVALLWGESQLAQHVKEQLPGIVVRPSLHALARPQGQKVEQKHGEDHRQEYQQRLSDRPALLEDIAGAREYFLALAEQERAP